MSEQLENLLKGNTRTLAKAITALESKLEKNYSAAQKLLEASLSHTGKSLRIGITGIPGVGKSTFIEALGVLLVSLGKKVAVLAVDPSSPINGGSIMGDKTRMEELSQMPNAFIRPSPTSGSLGGVAHKTREAMLLCEAAGYEIILVETVGVGQSEYEVSSMVDFFLVLMLPNSGDELQGIKRGIMELADTLIVNKADGDSKTLAGQTQAQYAAALSLMSHTSNFWRPEVLTCSALQKTGVKEVWENILKYFEKAKSCNYFEEKRKSQNIQWMDSLVSSFIKEKISNDSNIQEKWVELEKKVSTGKTMPYSAAKEIFNSLF